MESQWLTWAKQLHAIAATGSHYKPQAYDQERYTEVAEIAERMLAALGDVEVAQIQELFPTFAESYATPMTEVRAAVFSDDKILLVQERTDNLWTLPGGFAEVGLAPSENIIKEVQEEAGLNVQVQRLYALRHKARHKYVQDPRDFYKLFFLCSLCRDEQGQTPKAGMETLAAGYYPLNELPPLSLGRVLREDIELAFKAQADPNFTVTFD